uniref:Integrase catalytic domain-containing protein n=1 Tax=Cannabis sativa TaxID=3483 RepID=A0A803P381_CANSA
MRIDETEDLRKHLDEFNRIILDLSNIGVKIEDEDQGILLLSTLPKSYEHFVDTIVYRKESLSMIEYKGSNQSHKTKPNPKARKQCYYCKKEVHFRDECRALKAKLQRDKSKERGDVGEVTDGYESADVLVVSSQESSDSWILDSGCSFHMTPKRELFDSFKKLDGGSVLLGDNKACKVARIGTVRLKLHDDQIRSIHEVSSFKVMKGSLIVMKGELKNGIYYLKGKTITGENDMVVRGPDMESTRLWHLGHVKFSPRKHTTKGKLDYIHSHLWGASRTKTLGGASYFMSIVDDYTRKVWVFLLKTKNEAFNTFVTWKRLIENQTGKKIKKLRTDNGLEFGSDEFTRFCQLEGIDRHKTVMKNPQQNGLEERMNRTLLERVRCMLKGAGLAKKFWGHVPTVDLFKVFGCTAFAHIRQDKLEPRALKCLFLGYLEGVKGYKLWCLENGHRKCIISRDVVFKEHEMTMKTYVTNDTQNDKEMTGLEIQSNREEEDSTDQVDTQGYLYSEIDEQATEHERLPFDSQGYQLFRDRERRQVKPPERFGFADCTAFALASAEEIDTTVPTTYQEAINSRNKNKWFAAFDEEMSSLNKNKTWKIVARPPGQKLIGCKWIFKENEGLQGEEVSVEFKMKDLGEAKRILGIDIKRDRPERLSLSQKGYIEKLIDKFCMNEAKFVSTFLAQHFKLTQNQSARTKEEKMYMDTMPYASCVGCLMYCMTWPMHLVCWKLNLQKVVVLSSIEAEYMAAIEAIKEAVWLKGFTKELGFKSKRSTHIDIKLHFIRDIIAEKEVSVKKIGIKENPANMMTKYLSLARFRLCLDLLNILNC